jgi:hypothetical protein
MNFGNKFNYDSIGNCRDRGEDISPQRFPDNPIISSGKYLREESGFAEQGFYNADVWDVIDGLKAFISGA